MRRLLAFLVLCGCGGGQGATTLPAKPTPPPATAATTTAKPAGNGAFDVAAVCKRIDELAAQKCGKFGELKVDAKECVTELGAATADPGFKAFATCVVNPSCEEVTNCLAATDLNAADDGSAGRDNAPKNLRTCTGSGDMGAAVGIPKAEWDKRNGASALKYSQARSTKALPVEMCGIDAENRWLGGLACDDGSRPIKNSGDAESFRKGNVGVAGRCGSIVDVYSVKCPEKTYDIYIDAYICALPQ